MYQLAKNYVYASFGTHRARARGLVGSGQGLFPTHRACARVKAYPARLNLTPEKEFSHASRARGRLTKHRLTPESTIIRRHVD